MKHFRSLALAASLATAVAPCGSVFAQPLLLTNSAIEQRLNITLIGSFQATNQYNNFSRIEPMTEVIRMTSANLILAMAFDLVNADTNLLQPSELYFHNQIATNTPRFLAASALYLRNEIITNQAGTNLVEGVVIRRGTNLIDVTGFFPDFLSTNGVEVFSTNGPVISTNATDQVQTSRTGTSQSFQGLRLLSFQSTNVSFTLKGFAQETSVKPAQIGTNFVRVVSQTAAGTFSLNTGFVVSNAQTFFTNVVPSTDGVTFVTNVIPTNNVVVPVSGPAHATINLGGAIFRK